MTEPMAHKEPGIGIETAPQIPIESQAAPHRSLGRRFKDVLGNLLPGHTEQNTIIPISQITDAKVAELFMGLDPRGIGVQPKMSERVLLATLGWKTGAPGYETAQLTIREITERLTTTEALKETVEKGMSFWEPGNPDALQKVKTQNPHADLESESQMDQAARLRNVDRVLSGSQTQQNVGK
jgi:hypothetical protein